MFDFDFSEELRRQIKSLSKRDAALADALSKKVREVCSRDENTIDFYKNLKKPLNEFKRVHVGNFVLVFRVDKAHNFIFFEYMRHHDDAYGR
ncbi:MAG: addiction module toxin RelE [Candidatus Micrarchaeia archaeon]